MAYLGLRSMGKRTGLPHPEPVARTRKKLPEAMRSSAGSHSLSKSSRPAGCLSLGCPVALNSPQVDQEPLPEPRYASVKHQQGLQ